MASAWGSSWSSAWGSSWGSVAAAATSVRGRHDGGGKHRHEGGQKLHKRIVAWWRQYEELLARNAAADRAKAELKPRAKRQTRLEPDTAGDELRAFRAAIVEAERTQATEAALTRLETAARAEQRARLAIEAEEQAIAEIEDENAAILLLVA